jgi:very-short-patch-repair endonuclease
LQAATVEERTFAISPLPGMRIRAGNVWVPDFLLIGNGRAMLIEVDGPHHSKEHRRADDDMRDAQWRRCGVQVRRVPVEYTRADRASELDAWLRVEVKDGLGFGR